MLGRVRSYAQQLEELRFCVHELIPLLRSSGEAGAGRGEPLPRIADAAFRELQRGAQELLGQLSRRFPPSEPADAAVAARLGVPCAIVSGGVMPLERVAHGTAPGCLVTIGREQYALRTERRRPLPDLLRELRRERLLDAERRLMAQPGLSRMATEFVAEVESILDACHPQDDGRYRLYYRDRDHQLQHAHGHWLLVRGPVARRVANGSLFVGLWIKGATRPQRLAVVPRPSPNREGLWTPMGTPARGGCMGALEQYRRLLSEHYFTDAEAALHWLEAGVILATGRSAFHRQWRELASGDGAASARREAHARLAAERARLTRERTRLAAERERLAAERARHLQEPTTA